MTLARIPALFAIVLSAGLLAAAPAAQAQSKDDAIQLCQRAISERDRGWQVQSVNAERSRGDMRVTGNLVRGGGDSTNFTCLVDGRRVISLEMGGSGGAGRDRDRDRGQDRGPRDTTCESKDYRRNECRLDVRGGVRLQEQTSKTRCTRNVNWGTTRTGVWVDRGCAGKFESVGR